MTQKPSDKTPKPINNVVYQRRRARDKLINRITASLLIYEKFSFEDIVLNVMNNFSVTRRTAIEYSKTALFRISVNKNTLVGEKGHPSVKMEMPEHSEDIDLEKQIRYKIPDEVEK